MRQHGTRLGAIARLLLGLVLISGGIVLLFIPGPGLLLILFGFGLLGGESELVARGLDRIEPAMRRRGRRVARWWRDRSRLVQALIGLVALALATGATFTAWQFVT